MRGLWTAAVGTMGTWVAAGLWVTCSGEPLQPDPGAPEYQCQRAAEIVIDGKLDEEAWQRSQTTSEFLFPWPEQTGPRQRTVARLLWDDNCLYVAYECDDTDLTATYTHRDAPVFKDDCVEIFIAPEPDKYRYYYGFEMNCRAVLYDYFFAFPELLVSLYQARGVELATQMRGTLNDSGDTDLGWTLEVAIPFSNLYGWMGKERPEPGEVWRINMNRWDGTEPNRALSQWSPSGLKQAHPHRPEGFGALVFVMDGKDW